MKISASKWTRSSSSTPKSKLFYVSNSINSFPKFYMSTDIEVYFEFIIDLG